MVRQSAQQFTWEGFGLKLHIYADCLPADMEQCNIHIKASLAGLYEFPKNTLPVSAVFWLRCVPECKFGKSIGLEIQHCGKLTGDSRLSFARALCCQKELPYTFKDIGGDFTNHSFYGFIELKGFSGLAVVQEGSEERYYLASLLYKEISNIRSRCIVEIYIALTWNVDAHYSVSCIMIHCIYIMETSCFFVHFRYWSLVSRMPPLKRNSQLNLHQIKLNSRYQIFLMKNGT